MPREIFTDVVTPSVKLGTRAWYTLPVSIVAHVAIGAIVVVVPLMATDVLPKPTKVLASFVTSPPPPVPPPPPASTAPRRPDAHPQVNPEAAPSSAPDRIADETSPPALPNLATAVEGSVGEVGGTAPVTVFVPPPTPPPASQRPLPIGGDVRRPAKIKDVRPVYPEIAQRAGVTGRVMIEATIGADGRVKDARIIKSVALLDQAALDAVRQWEFTPTRLNGVAIPVIMTVTIDFTLHR